MTYETEMSRVGVVWEPCECPECPPILTMTGPDGARITLDPFEVRELAEWLLATEAQLV